MYIMMQLLTTYWCDMRICLPEAGNITRGQRPRVILPVKGRQSQVTPIWGQ